MSADEEWWRAAGQGRLLLQSCTACARPQHHPRALCASCGSTDLTWIDARGGGSVDSYTVVHRSVRPGLEAPYVVARVRLDEGPILLTHLVGDGPWACDARVRLAWRDGLPVFEAAGDPIAPIRRRPGS